jgi:hypothetical protein
VLIGGSSLFFIPDLLVPRWSWPLAPFNAHFLGAIYLAELIAAVIMVAANRWAPARLVLRISFVFSGLITILSLLYLDRFDYRRWTTWLWFALYVLSAIAFGYYSWVYRGVPPADPSPVPPPWRAYLLAQAAVYGPYGACLLVAPAAFSSFWPWKIDDFHAQLYSAIFLSIASGMVVLSHSAAPIEFFTMGITQLAFGLFAILGLVIVDASAHRVDWSSPGTWLWIAGLLVLALAGAAMVWWSFLTNRLRQGAPGLMESVTE